MEIQSLRRIRLSKKNMNLHIIPFPTHNIKNWMDLCFEFSGLDPVLNEVEFKSEVSRWLEKGFSLSFRDDAEIMQAKLELFFVIYIYS